MEESCDWKLKGETIALDFQKSIKNSNRLLELEDLLLCEDEIRIIAVFPCIVDVFTKVFASGIFSSSSKNEKIASYKEWLLGRYEDFTSHILNFMSHESYFVQRGAVTTLMSLLKLESEYPRINEKDNPNFPFMLFKKIISTMASDVLKQYEAIQIFLEYTKYYDIKLYLLKTLESLLTSSSEVTEVFLHNCFCLMYAVGFPKMFDSTETVETFAYHSDSQEPFQLKKKTFRKFLTSVWTRFLSFKLPPHLVRMALHALNEKLMRHLQNPCLMTDFLTNAFNKGGSYSLFALKGLFILMDKYNLEYPDFFVKLYALVDRDICNGSYNSRFFELANLFLSSTHLPAHLVAAFAKKLGRISLMSSTNVILKILRLLSNMMVNHPSLGILIHHEDRKDYGKDPFSMNIEDPTKSRAMESSLWEIKALHMHLNPEVSCKAKEFTATYSKVLSDMSEISNLSLQDMYRKTRKRKFDSVPLAISQPPIKQKK